MRQPRFDERAEPRRFLLETTPEQGAAQLVAGDRQHALRVLRMGIGDRLIGLDGRGHAWPLKVTAAEKRLLELEPDGPRSSAPAPGEVGASLPRIEMHVPFPKAGRADDLFDSLTQLGLTRLVPLLTERTAPHAREVGEGRLERLVRAGCEATKQCGRLWLPEVGLLETLDELAGAQAQRLVLSPSARLPLAAALAELEVGAPLWLVAGPEGGLSPAEEERLVAGGAKLVGLTPHVLRIETAAVAALSIAVHHLGQRD